ncbi:poly(ADP-ribose) glycohydrolase [Caerostris extrusa]|uniref:poly(ADP-ribose) glycohydrolase n=1 Tax=Caerostris extrusa TaxID=172846 RepID=A0AAV4P1N8_CAEEX|nr:poly(ADP-ribose) glycohydrolase [Caerostris extrusa]
MNTGHKRYRQINIKESFALNKKPKLETTSNMEQNLRDLMAAAAEKKEKTFRKSTNNFQIMRMETMSSETASKSSDHQISKNNLHRNNASSTDTPESEKIEIPDSPENCLGASADLFPSSPEIFDSPVIEECSSQEIASSSAIDIPGSSNSLEYSENTITEVDSQQDDDSNEEQHLLSFLNRMPGCSIPLPQLEPLENHSIMFSPHIRAGVAPRPYPPTYRDVWDFNHVRMPCSSHNEYPIEGLNGEKQIKSRWNLICLSLRRNIQSSQDLERAILQYNSQYREKWNFNGLHTFFQLCFSDDERCYFFEETLPKMINMALDLPNICTQPVPLLKKNKDHYVTMSQKQIGCLLLNAFFCTFPRRNFQPKDRKQRWNHEYATYPDINFNRLFMVRITSKEPCGTVTFHRQSLQALPKWEESKKDIKTIVIKDDGLIETDGHGMLQVDFANKFVGGGVLGEGCVQEEIRFLICPELIVSRLFVERLGSSEVLIITGVEQYNNCSGYSRTFKWEGNFVDETPRDGWGRRCTQLVAMDATHFRNTVDQFTQQSIGRELNKAYCGFYENALPQNLPSVASGNWGCGAFNGDPRLKFIIQLMAASHTDRDLLYFTFGNKHLKKELKNIYNCLSKRNLVVGDIWKILINFCNTIRNRNEKHPNLLNFLLSFTSNENQIDDSKNKFVSDISDSDKDAIAKLIEAVDDDSDTEIESNDPG